MLRFCAGGCRQNPKIVHGDPFEAILDVWQVLASFGLCWQGLGRFAGQGLLAHLVPQSRTGWQGLLVLVVFGLVSL